MCAIVVAVGSYAQDITVSGRVTSSEDGSALPGVNVVLKGTTVGTATDAEGKYSLSVPASGGSLVFSFIGLESKEVEIGGRSTIDVSLALDVTQLSEIVVTALGIEKTAESIGYSVGKVKADQLTQAKALNVSQALTGKVAGLRINNVSNSVEPNTRITLRGNRSFLGNNQALLILDGAQVPLDVINTINPNDIDNVSVLKGANSAALYGSDASNGAIVITTKKGTKQTPAITFSNATTWESVSFLPDFQNRFGAGTEAYSRVYIPFENQQYGPEFDGSMQVLGRVLEDGSYQVGRYAARDNERWAVWDVGNTTQNDLSFSAGDDRGDLRLSMQDVKIKGIVPGDDSRRTTFRMGASKQIDKIKVGFNIGYTRREVERTTSDFYFSTLNTAANIALSEMDNWKPYTLPDGSYNPANPNNYFNDYYNNPFHTKDLSRRADKQNTFVGSFDLNYKVTSWLSALYRLALTNDQFERKETDGIYNYNAWAVSTGKYIARPMDGRVFDQMRNQTRINQDFILTATKDFNDFTTTFLVGANVQERRQKQMSMTGDALVLDGLYNISNRVGEPIVADGVSLERRESIYGQLSVGYRKFLFLEVTGRNDWTSLLSPENRSFFYPGANLSFVASEAIPALKNNSVLSYAKITGSATKVGQVNLDPYQLQTVFPVGTGFPYGSNAGYTVGNDVKDPNLGPEFTTSFEVSGDFSFFDDKIGLELAYYTQETTDQTVSIDIARSTGFASASVNTGTMANKGFEVTLKSTPVNLNNGFRVDVMVNYANQNTEVKELYQGLDNINLSNSFGLTTDASLGQIFAEVGQQYPILKTVGYARDPEGRVIVDASSGYPTKAPGLIPMGRVNPEHTLGIQIAPKYKGLTLTVLAEYRGGAMIYHSLGADMWFTGTAETTAIYGRERFVFPNSSYLDPETGSYVANTNIAVRDGGLGAWDSNLRTFGENFATSADFWKLREVALTYEIPKSLLSNTKFIKAASVGLMGRNLLTFLPETNKYTDPEFANTTSNAVGINNSFNTPPTRTYGFNVSLTF